MVSRDCSLEIEECPHDYIKGFLDLDSGFILATSILAFSPGAANHLYANSLKYNLSKNIKATKYLEELLIAKGLYTKFGESSWWEAPLINLGRKNSLFVLFLVRSGIKHSVNIYVDYVEKVVRPALESLPEDCPTRKYYTSKKLCKQSPLIVFEEDYEKFGLALAVYTSLYIHNVEQSIVKDVFFYYCEHGMKCKIKSGLCKLNNTVSSNHAHLILFIQLHFGLTVNCPKDSTLLFKLKKLLPLFLNSEWNMRKMYFLLKYGHFCDVTEIRDFPSLSYLHCYETIQHRVPRSRYSKSIFCYELANGFSTDSGDFKKHAKATIDGMGSLIDLEKGHHECLDLRIEAVENYVNGNQDVRAFPTFMLEVLSGKNYCDYYSLSEGYGPSISCFPTFLDVLFGRGSLYIFRKWENYVHTQIGNELLLLKTLKVAHRWSPPTREHLNKVYWAENKLIAFLDGNKKRFDHQLLKSFIVYHHDLPFYTIQEVPFNYTIPSNIFLEHTNWNYFGSRCNIYFETLYTLSSALTTTNDKVERFFHSIALFWKIYTSDQSYSKPDINVKTYFAYPKGLKNKIQRSNATVIDCILNPKTLPMKLIVSYCFGKQLLKTSSTAASIRLFVENNIKYFPARFLDSKVDWLTWAKVMKSQDMLRLGAINNMDGMSKRQLNLLQNKDLKKAVQHLRGDVD